MLIHDPRAGSSYIEMLQHGIDAAAAGAEVRLVYTSALAARSALSLARSLGKLPAGDDRYRCQHGTGVLYFSWAEDPQFTSGAGG